MNFKRLLRKLVKFLGLHDTTDNVLRDIDLKVQRLRNIAKQHETDAAENQALANAHAEAASQDYANQQRAEAAAARFEGLSQGPRSSSTI